MSQGSSSISNGSSVISDAGANVAQVLEYYPFGGMRIDQRSGSLNEQRRFTSHEFDTGTMHSTEGRVSVILALIRAIEKSSIQFGKNVRATSLGIRGMSDEKSSCVSYFTLHDRFLDYCPKKEADRLVSRCSPDSQIDGRRPIMNDKDLITPPGGPRRRSSVQGVRASEVVRRTPDGRYVIERDSASTHTAADTPDVSNVVITPGGVRARSLVHQIRPGAALDGTGGRHRMLSRSGEVLADFGMIHPRPGGKPLMPENVVHPTPDALDGWITYAYWDRPGTPISWLSTTWVAPPQPATQTGQLIYLFNGIQNSTMIYQPVLQWGSNGLFGGNYWCVATWYADGQKGAAFHSPPVTVSVGDILTGVITLTDQSAIGFNYSGFFQDIANSGFDLVNVPELLQAVQTLECYRITKCSNYPNTDKTAMSDINIQTGTTPANVMWTAKDKVTDCGQHTSILSELGQVDLWYRAAGVLSGLTLFADTVRGGGSVQGQVTLELPVLTDTPVSVVALDPGGGFSGPSDAVSLDPLDGVVNVLQGRTMRQFTINANKVAQTKQVVIVASAGVTKKAHLTVERSA